MKSENKTKTATSLVLVAIVLMESVLVEDSLYRLDCAGHRVQTWDNGYDSRMLWTFWIFKQQPYFALEVVGRKRFFFFFDKTFAFPESKQTQFLLKPLYRVSRQIFFWIWQLLQDTLYVFDQNGQKRKGPCTLENAHWVKIIKVFFRSKKDAQNACTDF